jgi:hypothetical protein
MEAKNTRFSWVLESLLSQHKVDSLIFQGYVLARCLHWVLGFIILIVIKLNLLYLWSYIQAIKF